LKVDDKNIDSPSSVVEEKVRNFAFYVCCALQIDSCNDISQNIVGYSVFILAWALKQMDTQIINGVSTLTT
jgi:hypothetical protein